MLIEHFYWIWNSTIKIDPVHIGDRLIEISNIIQLDNSSNSFDNNFEYFHLKGREKFHLIIKLGLVEEILIFDSFKWDNKELIRVDKDVALEFVDQRFERTDISNSTSILFRITFTDSFVKSIGLLNKK